MKVLKFGGTSVGSPRRIMSVAQLIAGERKIVVLSAMSGTTNSLTSICSLIADKKNDIAKQEIKQLKITYSKHIEDLYKREGSKQQIAQLVESVFCLINSFVGKDIDITDKNIILAQGEMLSTNMMNAYLIENDIRSVILPALDFMSITIDREPDMAAIKQSIKKALELNKDADIYITQGFICMNNDGLVDNLERGGSDYTASIIGAAISAEEIQIWTDIDGLHNNDPRIVEGTSPVRHLHFDEAAELAYFGAKILHPTCIIPAKMNNIPVRLLNTMEPKAQGTIISNDLEKGTIKAVAAKDGITAINIRSTRMLLAMGFLKRIFEIFESYKTSIDMITTSEVTVSVTIDNDTHLEQITKELMVFCDVTIDKDMVIICVVGDMQWYNIGFEANIINALNDIPVRMISYGGSYNNVSILVGQDVKRDALISLSNNLFNHNY